MTTPLETKMAEVAATTIRPETDLGTRSEFPRQIWQILGQAGLLDPDAAASAGASHCLSIARAARILVSEGGNLGLALSWMIHHLVAGRLVWPLLGRAPWADDLRNRVKTGEATICLAVSEPDAGAHPKFMSARAEKTSGGFSVTGNKTYLTNGPIADFYAVVAITGEAEGRKAFSSFLVDRETTGMEVSGPMSIGFFKPSPHGSIAMNGCEVGKERLLGKEGEAFPTLVLPFRHLEDAVMTGPVTGAMIFINTAIAEQMVNHSLRSPENLEALGQLNVLTDTAVFLSDRIAIGVDQADDTEPLVLYFRQMAAQYLTAVNDLIAATAICLDNPAAVMLTDLHASAKLGKTVAGLKLQKIGHKVLR
ncbi:MAG: acyl-CoA dehydrogenase family protein [Desulfobacterales bacterium]|nr:acyl-CoA dehydrogenase family protein [Desulfobacterales bacterium]